MENGDGPSFRVCQDRVRSGDGLRSRTSLISFSRNCQSVSPPGLDPSPFVRGVLFPFLLVPQGSNGSMCALAQQKCGTGRGRVRKTYWLISMLSIHPCIENGTLSLRHWKRYTLPPKEGFRIIRIRFRKKPMWFVYYETIKRELNRRLIHKCPCDEGLKVKLRDVHSTTFIVTIIISVFVPGRSRAVQKLEKWVCTGLLWIYKSRVKDKTYTTTDGRGFKDFYHTWKNSILQQMKRKFWKIADALFRMS